MATTVQVRGAVVRKWTWCGIIMLALVQCECEV
jgi:hypothetical protein